MPYDLIFAPHAQRDLKRLDRQVRERVLNVLERIRARPYEFAEKLVGEPSFKIRIGDISAIIEINPQINRIDVLRIGHRTNIYDRL